VQHVARVGEEDIVDEEIEVVAKAVGRTFCSSLGPEQNAMNMMAEEKSMLQEVRDPRGSECARGLVTERACAPNSGVQESCAFGNVRLDKQCTND
jgi:hypothetical protein